MKRALGLSVLLICAPLLHGQISTDAAMAKLQAKQEARESHRPQVVSITQGELDDMKAQIASLKAEVLTLKLQLNGQASGPAPHIESVRGLAIGENRQQVFDFLRRHPQEYEITADTVSTPHTVAKTVVSSVQQSAGDKGGVASNQETHEQMVQEEEHTEKLVVIRKSYLPVRVGSHDEFNGVTHSKVDDFEKQWKPVEHLSISLVENQVNSIDRETIR